MERRAFGRRTVWKAAMIQLRDGRKVDCVITNESDGGVRLRSSETLKMGDQFALTVEADHIQVDCEVKHCGPGDIGAQFLRSPQRSPSSATKTTAQRSSYVQAMARRR